MKLVPAAISVHSEVKLLCQASSADFERVIRTLLYCILYPITVTA